MRWLKSLSPKALRIIFSVLALYSLTVGTYYFVDLAFINAPASDDCAWVSEGSVEVNRRIYDGIERKSFITMIIALFDLSTRKVTICRAGHNPGLVASDGQVSFLKLRGMGLGLEPGLIFGHELEMFDEELKPGKLFLFYSDGLTEAMNEKREEFGEARILTSMRNYNSVSAEALQHTVNDSPRSFRGNAEQNDDVTVVVVKAL
jgi:sigma-B regulation protein RsbU (phosphoserine phosphatase)